MTNNDSRYILVGSSTIKVSDLTLYPTGIGMGMLTLASSLVRNTLGLQTRVLHIGC
jgi:hypothetical protein